MSESSGCPCSRENNNVCCVSDCVDPTPGEDRCFPCPTFFGKERCRKTGQLRADKKQDEWR